MCEEYDVRVREYGPGMIVWHSCPLEKSEAIKVGAMSARPVLIVGEQRTLGASKYQVMPMTSNVNNFGIRVLTPNFDNPNSPDWKPGVVLCMEVWTVHRNFLERIIGCVPRKTLEKCIKAYSWVLGLSDEIPDFIQMSEEAMAMLGDGIPAKYIPVSLRNTVFNSPIRTAPVSGTKPAESLLLAPSDQSTAAAAPAPEPAPEPESIDPEDMHPILRRIRKYSEIPVSLSPQNRKIADELTINEQFDLYIGRLSIRSLAELKGCTNWAATQIAKFTNHRNTKGIRELVDALLDHRMDSRYLTGKNELYYRLISKSQMHELRRSPKGYQKDIGRFGLDYFKESLIGIVYGARIF